MKTKRYNYIRLKLSELLVGEREAKRTIKPCSLDKIKTAGLLFAVNSDNDIVDAQYVYNQLKTRNIEVSVLGYIVNSKEAATCRQPEGFNFYTDKDLDFLLRPKTENIKIFANTEFDILIDMDSVEYYPSKLLINSSVAHFRVGRFADVNPFDFMLCIEPEKGAKYYFEQLAHYLQKFN